MYRAKRLGLLRYEGGNRRNNVRTPRLLNTMLCACHVWTLVRRCRVGNGYDERDLTCVVHISAIYDINLLVPELRPVLCVSLWYVDAGQFLRCQSDTVMQCTLDLYD